MPSIQCNVCSDRYSMGGPIWLDEINDMEFVTKVKNFFESEENKLDLASKQKINGLLHGILNVKINK